MGHVETGDTLHRLMKQALDDGSVKDVDEAKRLFERYKLSVSIGPEEASSAVGQMVLLTLVSLGSRVFLGGVSVCGDLEIDAAPTVPFDGRLSEIVTSLGGKIVSDLGEDPLIVVGGGQLAKRTGFSIRTMASGWRGGICPAHSNKHTTPQTPIPLAATLSAALAVNEAYLYLNGSMPSAGRRTVGFSLWKPGKTENWLAQDISEPILRYLPSKLWLIGLGHLGQAYLWNLSLLPYAKRSDLSLVLQDVDIITQSTHSTSILTMPSMVGQFKTRCMAHWAEAKGFTVSLQERYFAADFTRQVHEPSIALCGLDNALGRHALDKVGYDMIIEAGLGRGHDDFRKIRLHVLPGSRSAEDIWPLQPTNEPPVLADVYKKMVQQGNLDQCGATLLAGKAVGAPFVGMVASCLAISEILRLLHGGITSRLIDLDLITTDHMHVALNDSERNQVGFNPGFTDAIVD